MADEKKEKKGKGKEQGKERPNVFTRIRQAIFRKVQRYEEKRRSEMGMKGEEAKAFRKTPYVKPK